MQIPFDLLPAMPRLFLDYVRDPSAVAQFYPQSPALDNVERFARECVRVPPEARERLADVLEAQQLRWEGTPGAVGKLRKNAVAVVTGQQAGLFTGPLLSIFKALTALKLAGELERRGVAAVPVFWIAADDHDREEIAWSGIVNQESRFQRITAAFEDGDAAPAAWLKYSGGITSAIEECFASLPFSDSQAEVRQIVESAYRPRSSPVDAFARMMIRLFRGRELVMIDPMDPAARRLMTGVLDLARTSALGPAVLERTRSIRSAGYTEQVRVDDTFTGLFALDGGRRVPLLAARAGGVPPSDLSPNVLLRPLVQDSLLPTAAYVAGPAEIAYYAQAGALYECLGRSMPPICPRITATLIEPQASRILGKYRLGLEDVFAGPERLRARLAGHEGNASVFGEVEREILGQAERLRPILEGADQTLGGALDNAIRKLGYQIDTLRSRFTSAQMRRNEVLERQVSALTNGLFPDRKLQERALNVTSFLVRYGTNLIALMDERLDLNGAVHQAVELR